MPNESGEGEQPPASLFAAAAAKFSKIGLSPIDSKYRLSSLLSANGVAVSATSGSASQPTAPASPITRRLQDVVRQASAKSKKTPFNFSDAAVAVASSDRAADSASSTMSPQKGKLPHKIRSSVSRMRSQRALTSTTTNSNNNPTSAPRDAVSGSRQRRSSVLSSVQGSLAATLASVSAVSSSSGPTRTRYSRQSNVIHAMQADLSRDRVSSTSQPQVQTSGESLAANKAETASTTVMRFMELLRPLQSSLASLREAGTISDDDDDDDDEADALFRQHERESSRILRICCSLDNLLFAIADQVREHKLDVMAIACGPAQEFVRLILSGMRQIAAAMTATTLPNGVLAGPDGLPSLTAKEERYLRDFLVEIADRWSELDDLLRGVYVTSFENVRSELAQLKIAHAELEAEKQNLELEVFDVREFASTQHAATLAVTSSFMRLADQQHSRKRPETDETNVQREDEEDLSGYDLTNSSQGNHQGERSAAEEIELLKNQCKEYGRLLEMAKQEIRLSHQERQSQNARLLELSQSLLKDQEVAQLRSELQSEKKRVKLLEMESLRLRETEISLNLKMQSLMLNQPGTKGPMRGAATTTTISTTTTPSKPQYYRPGSAVQAPKQEVAILKATPTVVVAQDDSVSSPSVDVAHPLLPQSVLATTVLSESVARTSWLSRVLAESEKNAGRIDDDDDGQIRRFLADLAMTEQEREAAKAQSNLRKRANAPTTGAPPSAPRATLVKKKKSKQDPPQDPTSVAISVDEWVSDTFVIARVRQLIWVFYEQYLMAEEARRIDPQVCGRAKWHRDTTPPLPAFVLHYFLERHETEDDALANLRRFVLVLAKLRDMYGDIQLFCDFLEGTRGREELHFMLWVLQACEAIELGINYDMESGVAGTSDRLGRHVCTLKALYLTRMVYQLLHVKSLKKPTPAKPVVVSTRANTPAVTAAEPKPSVPVSPSKKRRKNRPHTAGATSSASAMAPFVAPGADAPKPASLLDRVKLDFTNAIAANSGYPLTLESFNKIVLKFSSKPSQDELLDRLGPFYQPTGDERKVPLDVFLLLLMETFATQMHWRMTQLRALFIRLVKEEEEQRLYAAKQRQEEEQLQATAATKASSKVGGGADIAGTKPKATAVKTRARRAGIGGSTDRYLCGLNRDRLRQFLTQGGIATDPPERDVDALYVVILERANETPSGVHFTQLYDALLELELFGGSSFWVDFSINRLNDASCCAPESNEAVVDHWQQLSSHALVLTENDPNVYTRNAARRLMDRVSALAADRSKSSNSRSETEIDTVQAMRAFLNFAWRVAARRVRARTAAKSPQYECLTEFFYLNRAIQTIVSADEHYSSAVDLRKWTGLCVEKDELSVLHEIRFVEAFIAQSTASLGSNPGECDCAVQLKQQLQAVLLRYSLCVARLFDCYSSARYSNGSSGLTKDRWMALVRDLALIQEHSVSATLCEKLFIQAATTNPLVTVRGGDGVDRGSESTRVAGFANGGECVVDKRQFVALLVSTALQRHRLLRRNRNKPMDLMASTATVAQIVERFCREVVAPNAFDHRNKCHEEDFHRKLKNPLVVAVLLENRAFLRQIFYQFTAISESKAEQADREETDVVVNQLDHVRKLKSKHSSMALDQFVRFLLSFGLFDVQRTRDRDADAMTLRLDERGAAYLFRAGMSTESDDDSHMEFDEFAAAVAAIAALRNPHPFVPWHLKIDAFVGQLRSRVQHSQES